MSPTVYISYNWSAESKQVADDIDKDWKEAGITLKRDVRDIGFKGSLREFMTSMSSGDYVLLIINEGYSKSKNCMFEALELFKNLEFHNKILSVVLDSAKIYDPLKGIEYVHFWDEKIDELNERLKSLRSSANLSAIHAELSHYTRIRDSIDGFIGVLKDMLTIGWPAIRIEKYKAIFDYIGFTPVVQPPASIQGNSNNQASGSVYIGSYARAYTAYSVSQPPKNLLNSGYDKLSKTEKEKDNLNARLLLVAIRSAEIEIADSHIYALTDKILEVLSIAKEQQYLPTSILESTLKFAADLMHSESCKSIGEQLDKIARTKIKRIF